MEFLKLIKRRSFIHEVIYIALNAGLAVILMLIIQFTNSPWLAFALVLISMWRIFAVRPRFWIANILANLVSIIIGISFVVLLYAVNPIDVGDLQSIVPRLVLTVLYICWLLLLKPKSKRVYVILQSSVALFVGVTALYTMSYSWLALPTVLFMWIIGFATASHILSSYDEENHTTLLSLIWGLVLSEIGWLAYHWTIAYRLPYSKNLLLPQISIISLCLGFLVYKSYDSYHHHQKIRFNDIILPLIFTIGIICALLLIFNGVSTNVI
ncbi:MAG: hypothetical protein WCK26_01445 [Candidatus Saccharibacteria bacterium]